MVSGGRLVEPVPAVLARGWQKTKLNFCVFLTVHLSNFPSF